MKHHGFVTVIFLEEDITQNYASIKDYEVDYQSRERIAR